MISQIDVTGYDMAENLAKDRRRRSEAEQGEGMAEMYALLLPLVLAVARLSARMQVAGGVQ